MECVRMLIITDVPFWTNGAGNTTRIKKLIAFLIQHSTLTVIYLGEKSKLDEPISEKINLIFLKNENKDDKEQNIRFLRELTSSIQFNLCLVEYVHFTYFLQAIPKGILTILDANDIVSERNESFFNYNYPPLESNISKDDEFKLFNLYNRIIFVCKEDYEIAAKRLPKEKLIYAPHAVEIMRHRVRKRAKTIGFIASCYLPNVDAIIWFLKFLWPKLEKQNIKLNIYGDIGKIIPSYLLDGPNLNEINLKGPKRKLDRVYDQVDIIVNPVRIGSGLKIKNVEAMANGISLITTSHGARGLEEGIDNSFYVADTISAFVEKLQFLIDNFEERKRLSCNSLNWMTSCFNEDKCFRDIKSLLKAK